MKQTIFRTVLCTVTLGALGACASEVSSERSSGALADESAVEQQTTISTTQANTFRNAMTGELCTPDMETYEPFDDVFAYQKRSRGGQNSPTGMPGDNLDDEQSGMVDCYFDGNSGQGDDAEECEIPLGCDDFDCCKEEDTDAGDNGDGELGDDTAEDSDEKDCDKGYGGPRNGGGDDDNGEDGDDEDDSGDDEDPPGDVF